MGEKLCGVRETTDADEARWRIEKGFEYVCEIGGVLLLRKRKE